MLLKNKILRLWYKLLKKNPAQMEMVQYWKKSIGVAANLTRDKDGSLYMNYEGEKYPFPGFPRGHLLDSSMSKLKHEIKNQIFNESWYALEAGKDRTEVIQQIKQRLFGSIAELANKSKYDMLPIKSMAPAVKEIHRAWTKVAPSSTYPLRDYLCFIIQEDDSYRWRVQWLVNYFSIFKFNPVKQFEVALSMLEHAEVVGDMKERIRLLRRILLLALEDPKIKHLFIAFFREIQWSKVQLSKGDKYHFRGKYFKVDYPYMEY